MTALHHYDRQGKRLKAAQPTSERYQTHVALLVGMCLGAALMLVGCCWCSEVVWWWRMG